MRPLGGIECYHDEGPAPVAVQKLYGVVESCKPPNGPSRIDNDIQPLPKILTAVLFNTIPILSLSNSLPRYSSSYPVLTYVQPRRAEPSPPKYIFLQHRNRIIVLLSHIAYTTASHTFTPAHQPPRNQPTLRTPSTHLTSAPSQNVRLRRSRRPPNQLQALPTGEGLLPSRPRRRMQELYDTVYQVYKSAKPAGKQQ